ncbi:unnamed protein product, partial [Ectocarpus sp. 12 AP-2014]
NRYEGYFKGDERHGKGTLNLVSGGNYEGQWQDNVQHGELTGPGALPNGGFGTAWYASGIRYAGQWLYGKSHGEAHAITPRGRDTKGSSMVASATAAEPTSTPMVTATRATSTTAECTAWASTAGPTET